jgi:mannose-1-phosphate guanylyltransferase
MTEMPGCHKPENRWAVILAGGEGVRLRSLTRVVTGDDRPKQFCPLLGGKTLLAHTRERTAHGISPDRTLFVLMKAHERFYADELAGVPSARMVVQPCNRGTLPAILCALLRIRRDNPEAVVAFFPSDHHYANGRNFMAGVDLAFGAAETDTDSIILLGAPATHPETDYGWIEAEAALSSRAHNGLLRVKRFVEKPSKQVASDLLNRGCVWNTFVMAGRAETFLNAIRSRAAELCQSFESVLAQSGSDMDSIMKAIYASLPVSDLSSQVLAACPERLRVLCLGNVGWSDLGNPRRLIEVLARDGEKNDWLPLWHKERMRLSQVSRPIGLVAKVAGAAL